MKKLIAYDLDGTLIDTGKDIALSMNRMLKDVGRPELPHEEIYGYVGQGLHHLIGCCLKSQDRKEIERGAKIYRSYYEKHMMDHSRLYPGALEFLKLYEDRVQVLITNKPNPFTVNMLKALEIADFFSVIVAGDGEFPRKPNPAAMQSILENEHIDPKESVMIGDSLIDLEMGRRAGMSCVMLSHGFTSESVLRDAKPDALCKNFDELLKLARQQSW